MIVRLCTAAVLASTGAALAIGVAPASAAPPNDLVYSIDGGATWSTSVSVPSGQTILVRQFYNNSTSAGIAATSVITTLPSGFTLVPGSTRVCLNPGTTDPTHPTTELACNTEAGQTGPIVEGAVWSGGSLTVSPTAGVYGQPANAKSGILAAGRKRYVNIDNCEYLYAGDYFSSSVALPSNPNFSAGTNASNTATAVDCKAGSSTYKPRFKGVQHLSLLGKQFVNFEQCDYHVGAHDNLTTWNATPGNAKLATGTNTSNTAATSVTCGPGGPKVVPAPAGSGFAALNLLTNRYLNISQCSFFDSSPRDAFVSDVPVASGAGIFNGSTTATNVPAAALSCGAGQGAGGHVRQAANSHLLVLDTLDPARGQGFVEFKMTAPTVTATTTYPQTGGLAGAGTGGPTSTGSVTVIAVVDTPMIGSWGVAAGALLALSLAAGGVLYRRRRPAAACG